MADKFPELEDDLAQDEFVVGDGNDTDFLRREAEILGDEFKTEQDSELLSNEDSDSKTAGTSVHEADAIAAASYQNPDSTERLPQETANEDEDDEFGEPQVTSAAPVVRGTSEAVKNWRERRELEISQRDQAEEQAKADLQEEAAKHIDDFYENYNIKKQQGIEQTTKDAEEFLAKNLEFDSKDGSVWDKALELINLEDADIVEGRDRSKLKDILQGLKNNPNAPGIAGKN